MAVWKDVYNTNNQFHHGNIMKNPLSSMLKSFSSVFNSVFGKLNWSWSSPPWMTHTCQKAKTSPKTFWGSVSAFILLVAGILYGINYYQNLPKPIHVTASIATPAITPNETPLVPSNLEINFGIQEDSFIAQSVAPIAMVGKVVTEGVQITPSIPGTWFWRNDSQLIFTPTEDWQAGQKYTVHFEPKFFPSHVKMAGYDFSFLTQAFTADISEFKFYQDPTNAESRTAVATINFNYAVDTASLEKNTSLMFQVLKKGVLDTHAEQVKFSYTYDDNKRVAYLHSENVALVDVPRYLLLTLNKNVASLSKSTTLKQTYTKNVLIPDSKNFLKVVSASTSIVRNDKDRPEQVLTVETTLGVKESDFNKSVHIYLLPKDYPATSTEKAKPDYMWQNPGEITSAILSLASPLTKEVIPTEQNYSTLHSFKFNVTPPRYIYVKIDKGLSSLGNFNLNRDYEAVMAVPEYPKEISFLHKGALLALNGEKKLSTLVRGVAAVKFDFARVLPGNINQLITQTEGDFNNPYFINPSFNQQNISQIFSEVQQFDTSDISKQQYTALDLGKYLGVDTNTQGPQGLFLLQATGWDIENKAPLDVTASRLILITDLGMLVKDNNNGTHDVFVNSITQGLPAAGVEVSVLGKNGLSILSRVTDDQGRATFPNLNNFVEDRQPIVYLAKLNNDVSFIPYNNYNRQLNFSKFDIGGIYSNNSELNSLNAYMFSDRGIYRPGDTVHIGMIIKQGYVQPQPAGLPLQVTVQDSRGTTIKDEKITLNDTGYMDLDFTTSSNSPTGEYTISLYLVKDNYPQNLLGTTSVKVSEFQPDRMRITSSLIPEPSTGWLSPNDVKAQVTLWNLYGAPATDRDVKAKIVLTPQQVKFDIYPEYIFSDPLFDPKKPPKTFTETLTDGTTDDEGQVEFNLNLEQYEKATYQLTFFAEGFEAGGGRSVSTLSRALISPLPYFVGYKPDGDLTFIKQNSLRTINYLGVNPQLETEEIKGLKIQLISMHPVTTLVKKADGTYQYQSIIQSSIISTTDFNVEEGGTNYSIPTQEIGDYSLKVLGQNDTVLSQLNFSIVGDSEEPLAKNAELSLKLDKEEYQANEDIQLQITAPYTGSGLITIERDKVYATQWFKTDATNSVQTIHIPADFEGNGYVNVAFIRDWDSPELFISPLSYSVVPFTVNHDNHKIKIDLDTLKVARPGEPFAINYKTDKPGKIIVFAVDEGILQVANYETPDPLEYFFRKHALEVLTQQTVDQILPKFIQDREISAVGGDDGDGDMASHLNPFKRKTDLPVVYWSGIIDTDTANTQLTYQVPDYFNGTIRVMAVAVSADSVGANETSAEIRGDFILNPNVPTFVAPGDEFEVSVSVANNLKDSAEHTQIAVDLTTSPEIEIIGNAKQSLEIAEGHEKTLFFKLRAKSLLGGAKLTFTAAAGNKSSKMDATLSVRPATPLFTNINTGVSQDTEKKLDVLQNLYPQYRNVNAKMSTSPLIVVFGLQQYMDNFPYGCTEQLVSKVLPLLAMNGQPWFAKDRTAISDKVSTTMAMLGQRQMSNGGFSYWPGLGFNSGNTFASVYAMHFLTEARAQGFNPPNNVFSNGISYLKELASQNISNRDEARIQAYAIYLLTRNEIVTTNYLANLQLALQSGNAKAWQQDITSAYIAASYQLLKSFDEANKLIGLYQVKGTDGFYTDFFDKNTEDAQYLYLVEKHFPNLLNQVGNKLLMQLVETLNNGEINTVLSGYDSLALGAYPQSDATGAVPQLSMTEVFTNNQEQKIYPESAGYQELNIEKNVKQLNLDNSNKLTYFYQLTQSGFSKTPPTESLSQGIEIYREYRNADNEVITSTLLGSEIEVHLQVRSLDNTYLSNIAIEDLLPGGFEVVRDSVVNGSMDFSDAREDRVNFFGTIGDTATTIVYKIKAINTGKYIVPPAYAESMYNPKIQAHGVASVMTVQDPKN
jgi:uncharacterized protein YfaS (alpha-2-macroglobulin family)